MVVPLTKNRIVESLPFFWNFRLMPCNTNVGPFQEFESISLDSHDSQDCHTWEVRYFWPLAEPSPIIVPSFGREVFNINQYRFKFHQDLYLLTNDVSFNLKVRKSELLLKKQELEREEIIGFSKKKHEPLILEKGIHLLSIEDINKLLIGTDLARFKNFEIASSCFILKESMQLTLKTVPAKIEFSKLYLPYQTFLSFCIESHSFEAVKHLKNHLNFEGKPCSYTMFLTELKNQAMIIL
ncbi:hypothetical protein [Candidatus Paracaedibacter symbiosus]|uniref:hypothetical protein n=1 Tax=Candidatus Paracaedibacter symbiosus TaxID=244582 RepID=UPI000509FC71|nr:hypothetical protein [Candidatus Paracaedibacter symbiosus]